MSTRDDAQTRVQEIRHSTLVVKWNKSQAYSLVTLLGDEKGEKEGNEEKK